MQPAHVSTRLGYKAAVSPGTLEITEQLDAGRCTLVLAGELDMVSASALERAAAAALGRGDRPSELVLDVRELTFVDSTGFRALIAIKESCFAAGTGFAMTRGPDAVQRVFDISGVLKRLPFV